MVNFILILFILLTFGCEQKPVVRHYTEVIIKAEDEAMADPHAMLNMGQGMDMSSAPAMPTANDSLKDHITWTLPSGWIQDKGSSMRLATLRLNSNSQAFDCSIISLPGGAGGLEANLKRWAGQINLQASDEEIRQLISASKDMIFDFSQLQSGEDSLSDSMLAAMVEVKGATVFVKLAGSIDAVKTHKKDFIQLVRSIKLK